MGLFDIFKSKPSQKAILSQTQKAKEVYGQPEYRRAAMEKLLKWGTDDSLKGLLQRLTVVVQSPHWDEDEKRWVREEFINMGRDSLPILRDFIFSKNELNHALIAYRKIVDNDYEYKELLMEALRKRPPSDHRSVQGKQEIIAALSELETNDIVDLLLTYLDDHSDDVQCTVIEALHDSKDEKVHKKLIELLSSKTHSARVLRMIANTVFSLKLKIDKNIELSSVVKEDFTIDGGLLARFDQGV